MMENKGIIKCFTCFWIKCKIIQCKRGIKEKIILLNMNNTIKKLEI